MTRLSRRTIAAAAIAAAVAAAAILTVLAVSGSHAPAAHPAASPVAARDRSCQIAADANSRAIALIGGMTAANSAPVLSKAGAIYSVASGKISNSGVPLLHTRAGRLAADLALAAMRADGLVVAIRFNLPAEFRAQSPKLVAAEEKITAECRGG